MQYFSDILKNLLEEKGISQKEFYTQLNIGKNQLHYWIKNKAEPDLTILTKIAIYLNVSTDYLLGLEDEFGNKIEPRIV